MCDLLAKVPPQASLHHQSVLSDGMLPLPFETLHLLLSLPLGGFGWHWSFVAGHCCWCLSFDAQGLLHAGVFFFLSVVVLGGCLLALWGFCPPGVLVFFPWDFGWLRWRLSCGVCLLALWDFCPPCGVRLTPLGGCGLGLVLLFRLFGASACFAVFLFPLVAVVGICPLLVPSVCSVHFFLL